MSTITHPSMRGAMGVSAQNKQAPQAQSFVVEDATQNIEKHLEQFETPKERPLMPLPEVFQRAKEVQKPILSPQAEAQKKKVESILFLGRLTKTLELAGVKFEINTLTNKEQNDIVRELYTFTDGADLFVIRTLTLANALKSVDGISLDDLGNFSEEEESQFKNAFHRRMAIIDGMQLAIVEKVYDEYTKLLEENEKLLSPDLIKK